MSNNVTPEKKTTKTRKIEQSCMKNKGLVAIPAYSTLMMKNLVRCPLKVCRKIKLCSTCQLSMTTYQSSQVNVTPTHNEFIHLFFALNWVIHQLPNHNE